MDSTKYINIILQHWNFTEVEIVEQFHKDSPRPIFKVKTDEKFYLLKGIPDSKPESVIAGNISAHKYLGNEKGIAPCVIPLSDGSFYIKVDSFWFYLMEFIDGQNMEATPENEYLLGQIVKKLHSCTDYNYPSGLNEDKSRFYGWFTDKPFKTEFDAILDTLPDFEKLDRCFIHTDLGPHNSMIRNSGEAVLIDLDDAGIGSRYLDLGWAFIMQFVEHTEDMQLSYRFDLAEAFLKGYYGDEQISRDEYDLLWYGAAYMHISYMKCYGPGAVDSLWMILKFGLEQKERLWNFGIYTQKTE